MADDNNKEEILLEIIVSNDAATQAIFESQKQIDSLKKSQADLSAEFKKGAITQEEYSKKSSAVKAAIGQQNDVIRANEKELKNNIKSQQDNADSLSALRAQLSNNTKAYDNLSEAERNSAKGQALQKSIVETTTKLNEAEQATLRFQRKIGNYPETMGKAGQGINQITGYLGKMSTQLRATGNFAGNFTNILDKATTVIGGFVAKSEIAAGAAVNLTNNLGESAEALGAVDNVVGNTAESVAELGATTAATGQASAGAFSAITKGAVNMGKAFLSPPIIIVTAIILAIIAAIKLLSAGFKKNDEASEKLSEAFAVFTPILDAIGTLFTWVAGAVADLVLGFSKATAATVDFIAGLFGVKTVLSEAAEEARNLVKAQDDLEEAERDYTVNNAKRNVERAKLMAEVTDKQKNDAKTRIALLQDALELDKQNLVDEKAIADERLRIIEQTAKNENDTSDDTAKKIADARAAAYNAQAKYFEGVKEINKKLNSAEEELANEQQKRFDDWKKNKDDQTAKEKQYVRQLEDLVTAQIKNETQRQIEAEKLKTERENAELKERLKNEVNLTKEARAAINDIISINKQNLDLKIEEINKKASDEEIKAEADKKTKIITAQIELATKGTQEELNLLIAKLELQKSIELSNTELTNVERLAIINKYDEQEIAIRENAIKQKQTLLQNNLDKEFELMILDAENKGAFQDEVLRLELEKQQAHYDALINMDAETKNAMYATQLDYEIAVAESKQNIVEAEQRVTEAEMQSKDAFVSSMKSITGSLSTLISTIGEESYEAAQYAKALALVNIGIAAAEGIAGVVKTAAKSTTWYEMAAAIATGVVSVASAIASANKAFKATPEPRKPKFSTGGVVRGYGSGTSDSVPIDASDGEIIMNARSSAMFSPMLSALNVAGGGVPFGTDTVNSQIQGEDSLARAFARGAAQIKNVVDVREITKKQKRVEVLENI